MLPVFARFRAGFAGKASPVHFWWGSFDLAVSRFSGGKAPQHPGGVPGLPDRITREAYSDEVSSAGFWAGGVTATEPFFYTYIYPEPEGFRSAKVAHGRYDETFGEFVLPYADVRASDDPDRMLLEFFQSAYDLSGRPRALGPRGARARAGRSIVGAAVARHDELVEFLTLPAYELLD